MSSAHLTFNTAEEQAALAAQGYLRRTGIQYHWLNQGYASFDAFLMTLKQSKRNNIRKVFALPAHACYADSPQCPGVG